MFFSRIILIEGGASDLPEIGCKCVKLHLLGMECARAKLHLRLVERGQTYGRHNPD